MKVKSESEVAQCIPWGMSKGKGNWAETDIGKNLRDERNYAALDIQKMVSDSINM